VVVQVELVIQDPQWFQEEQVVVELVD